MPNVRAYLRASTDEQDAQRARQALADFAQAHGRSVVSWYAENESVAKLDRPELFRLLADCLPGDVLLVEQVDRLSRLTLTDWDRLKDTMKARGVRVVALDLPTSHGAMRAATGPVRADGEADPTEAILSAVNAMLLDMLAVMARKDYTDRRRRQSEGIAKAKTAGLYKGRQVDQKLHANILALLDAGKSWSQVQQLTEVSRSTILRAVNGRKAQEDAAAQVAG
jgi:DNA invertase Pin-like site-specific DNA recombinase